MIFTKLKKKTLTSHLIVAGLILNFGISHSYAEDLPINKETEVVSEEKQTNSQVLANLLLVFEEVERLELTSPDQIYPDGRCGIQKT